MRRPVTCPAAPPRQASARALRAAVPAPAAAVPTLARAILAALAGLAVAAPIGCGGPNLLIPIERHNDMTDLSMGPQIGPRRAGVLAARDTPPPGADLPYVAPPSDTVSRTGPLSPDSRRREVVETVPTHPDADRPLPTRPVSSDRFPDRTGDGSAPPPPPAPRNDERATVPARAVNPAAGERRSPAADELVARAAALMDDPGSGPEAAGRIERAASLLEDVVRLWPASTAAEHAWVRLGHLAEQPPRRDYRRAVECYRKAAAVEPRTDAWYRAGLLAEGELGDRILAAELFEEAARHDPDADRRLRARAHAARLNPSTGGK